MLPSPLFMYLASVDHAGVAGTLRVLEYPVRYILQFYTILQDLAEKKASKNRGKGLKPAKERQKRRQKRRPGQRLRGLRGPGTFFSLEKKTVYE